MSNVVEAVADKPGLCYGCGACMNACLAGAIKVKPDGDGFLGPVVDVGLCLGCGACEDVCPRLHPDYSNEVPGKCLAVMAEDGIRMKSSTGGVFTLLARYVLDRGGIVFGAELSDDFLVRHVGVESERDLARLRGSKYAQSDTGATYREAKAALDAGRYVLYCGCPCQIAGLKAFLGKDYDNLLMVDLLCGGNPSAYSLREYLDETWGLDNVRLVRFRDMAGWDFRFEVFLRSGEIVMDPSNAYMKMYLEHALNKPACGTCQFDRLPRQGDITIGDFWNIRSLAADMDDGKGTSVVLLNNVKARQIWGSLENQLKSVREFTVDDAYNSGVGYIKISPAKYAGQVAFDKLRAERGFTYAVRMTADHYDVGIAGTWLANYGTISTNWALYNVIRSFGLSACVLDVTGHEWMDGKSAIPDMFIASKGIPRASSFCAVGDYRALNGHCDSFVVGSDQLWGDIPTYLSFEEYFHLGFADAGKRLVAAGTALGGPVGPYSKDMLDRRREWLSRFSYIGVREDFGPEELGKAYNVDADHVQDPVFLCDKGLFQHEADNSDFVPSGRFVFAYMLYAEWDGPEFQLAKRFAKARGCGLIMSRGLGPEFIEYDANFSLVGKHATYYRNWMRCITDAEFVLTNSFHGTCMPLVFRKDFAVVVGAEPARFGVLARDFGIGDRMFESVDKFDMDRMLVERVDYARVGPLMEAEKARCLALLKEALCGSTDRSVRQEGDVMVKQARVSDVGKDRLPFKALDLKCSTGNGSGGQTPVVSKFMARLRACSARMPSSDYLGYLRDISRPDLESMILVEIPSYNDPDIVNTVKAALAMAANPERVRFAVCLQDDDSDTLDALRHMPQVKLKHYALKDAPGTCAARYECNVMYGGEDFVFHMDAHMRFAKFWDVAVIDQWRLCGSEKAVLTGYAKAFGPEMLEKPVGDAAFTGMAEVSCRVMAAAYFSEDQPEASLRVVGKEFPGPVPRLGAFVCAHYLFCRGSVDAELPVDPKMRFFGDETGMMARYWTHGCDIYQPGVKFVFHIYINERMRSGHGAYSGECADRKRSESAMTEEGTTRAERELVRMEALLGIYGQDNVDLGRFGLGTERSLEAYQEFCGVDFRRMTIRNFAARGLFGESHDGDNDMGFFDWRAARGNDCGNPPAGRAMGYKVRGDIVERFYAVCKAENWYPRAALTEAIRFWAGRELTVSDRSAAVVSTMAVGRVDDSSGSLASGPFRADIEREEIKNPGSGYLDYLRSVPSPDMSSTILVEIPSYDDPDVVNTVKAALAMAASPERIRFAVCLQDDDPSRLEALSAIPRVKVKHYSLEDAPGGCGARYECNLMYDGEDFVLHLDSHMRFARFWDVASIHQWQLCSDKNAVVSSYAPGFGAELLDVPVDDARFTGLASIGGSLLVPGYFPERKPDASMRVGGVHFDGPEPRLGAFISAHWLFCRGEVDDRVKVDPKMRFFGDEMGMCVRYWTHGYNIYQPGVGFVFHLYADNRRKDRYGNEAATRAKLESVLAEEGITRAERELRRMEKLLGIHNRPDVDLGEFGFGTERTLEEYQDFCGVDFRRMSVRKFAVRGKFGQERDLPDDMETSDWKARYGDACGDPPDAAVLDIEVRGAVADLFDRACEAGGWYKPAALADAVRTWSDREGGYDIDQVVYGTVGGPVSELSFKRLLLVEKAALGSSAYLNYLEKLGDPDLASTILIEIPSYCDPEILKTVDAARKMAANPERIRFAVCLQDDDRSRLEALKSVPGCRVKYYTKAEAPGACAARYDCQQMYDGEDFVLHTDAHMRFARFWDVAMISQWRKCHNEKAVLADYAYHVSKDDMALPVDDPSFTTRAAMECGVVNALFFESNSPELRMHVPHIYQISDPVLGAFVCAHCMFGRPLIDQIVPVDPHMDFVADESSVAVRLWTHGFDIWHAGVRCIYHAYDTVGPTDPSHGHESSVAVVEGGITRQERQRRRLEKLFGVYDRQDVDLTGFDLGKERSLQEYQEFCGVDFRNMTIRKFAADGTFGCKHEGEELDFIDWMAVFEKDQGRPFPDQGEKLDVKVRPDAVSDFLEFCKSHGVHPQAALTEAVRQWTDNRRRGRFC